MKTYQPDKKSILLIDDEPALLQSLGMVLQQGGYHVSDAATSEEAIHLLEASIFHLVLLDLKLSDADGFQLLTSIRQQYPQIPILIFSGSAVPSDPQEARRLGAVGFIQKPMDPSTLLQMIQEVLHP